MTASGDRLPGDPKPGEEGGEPLDFDSTLVPLPEGWSLLYYGSSSARVRRRLREAAYAAGLLKADKGGSVYLGVSLPGLDERVDAIARAATGDQVHLIPGSYSQTVAGFFTRSVADNAYREMAEQESQLRELEAAMAGDLRLAHPKTGRPRNLASTGDGRLDSMAYVLAAADTAAQRLSAAPGTARVGERLAARVAQLRAWAAVIAAAHARQRGALQSRYEVELGAWEAAERAAGRDPK